jgi:hypothetical protein
MPIRCAAQRPQTMEIYAATGDGDNIRVERKYDEPWSLYSNCNINYVSPLCAITFWCRPNACYLPSLLFQLVDAARQNCYCKTDSRARCLSNNTRVDAIRRVFVILCHGRRRRPGFCEPLSFDFLVALAYQNLDSGLCGPGLWGVLQKQRVRSLPPNFNLR